MGETALAAGAMNQFMNENNRARHGEPLDGSAPIIGAARRVREQGSLPAMRRKPGFAFHLTG